MNISHTRHRSPKASVVLALLASITFFNSVSLLAQSGAVRPRTAPPMTGQPPQRTSQPAPAGQSTVTGRLIYQDTEQPLKGVRVRIFTAEDSERAIIAFANNNGEFRVEKLAAGKYYVTLEGEGVAMPSGMGMRLPVPISAIPRREDFEEIIPKHDAEFTVDGTNSVAVEVRVKRGGSISGKVLKADGAPAADVAVNVVSREGASGGPFTSQFSGRTDKNGVYRIDNVPAADYIVAAAIEDTKTNLDIRSRMRGESRAVTYHPAALSIRDAITVRVDPGRETGAVNITLVPRNAYGVSGTVVRQRDGAPIVGATVVLRNKESEMGGSLIPGMGQRTAHTDADGNWSFLNVMEGSYVVTALAPISRPARPNADEPPDREQAYRESRQRFLVKQQDVNVAGAELRGLELAITGPGSIRGVVETADGAALPSDLVIFLELVTENNRPGPPLPVRVNADGSFSFSDIQAGDVYLSGALPQGSKYFIESVTAGGANLRRTPLKVIEGADSEPVRVKISSGLASVAGRALSSNGEGMSGWVVVLVPSDQSEQRFRTSVLTVRTSPDGTYALSGAPGGYLIFARQREELPAILTPEFLRTGVADAQRITLKLGERKTVELRVSNR